MKKAMTAATLGYLLLATVSFLVVFLVIDSIRNVAEGKTADNLCRLSIAARARTGIGVDLWVTEIEKEIVPLICPTDKPKDIGKKKSKEDIKKYIADEIASCWYRFQEGNIADVFQGSTFNNKCQICQPINVKEWEDYEGEITV